jgi:hypothetical protein
MIIGISGKKGSGKDTVAEMIKQFTPHLNWETHKFADALKDMVCRLIGCTREQLEDREFKESPLGEEWWCYDLGNGIILPRGYYSNKEDNEMCEQRYLRKMTPRLMLQLLGTEGVRNVIHPNSWVNATMSGYLCECEDMKQSKGFDFISCMQCTGKPYWLITDMRFPNEMKAVNNKQGVTLRIERPDTISKDQHPSETALDDAVFHHVITNDGDLDNLRRKVQDFLGLYGII